MRRLSKIRPSKIKLISSFLVVAVLVGTVGFYFAKPAFGATKCWTGGGATNNWSDTGNWAGGSLPSTTDVATFHGASCTTGTPDKSVTIDQNVDLSGSGGGINIGSNYGGTITQNSTFTITLGSSGWVQAGGTFLGGDSAITFNSTNVGSLTVTG